ncbi:MAG: hypothetical protein Q9200_001871 [Gallowayella weberi]
MKAFYLLLALLPLALAKPKCECPLVNCLGDDAARCKCANDAAIACASRCATKPKTVVGYTNYELTVSNPLTTPKKCPTPTTTSPPAPTQTLCGSRGIGLCASNQYCIADPNNLGCSLIADCPGLCVQLNGPMCGGFAGFPCPEPDQACISTYILTPDVHYKASHEQIILNSARPELLRLCKAVYTKYHQRFWSENIFVIGRGAETSTDFITKVPKVSSQWIRKVYLAFSVKDSARWADYFPCDSLKPGDVLQWPDTMDAE